MMIEMIQYLLFNSAILTASNFGNKDQFLKFFK